jgi:hypothetical protein
MELDRAMGVIVALRRCNCEDAGDELLAASKRHRVPPVAVARALVALAEGSRADDGPATSAARYEWGSLMEQACVTESAAAMSRARQALMTICCCPAAFAHWVRGAYPSWSPKPCHVALVALCGQDGPLIEQKPRRAA